MAEFRRTPLWPAGHLPLKGGDQALQPVRPVANVSVQGDRIIIYVAELGEAATSVISPLEGEMAGRPEGGAKERWAGGSSIFEKAEC